MVGRKSRLLVGTAIIASLSAPLFAQQAATARIGNSLDANSIQGMTAPRYSRVTPMGGVDYGDDLGSHEATQALDMMTFGIYNLADPTADRPDMAANKAYVDQVGAASRDNLGNHTATQNIDMSNFEILDLGAPSTPGSAATKGYVDSQILNAGDNLGDHIATQILDMSTNRITNIGVPVNDNDAATKAYVDQMGASAKDNLGDHTATMDIIMGGSKITGLGTPTNDNDAATKFYVDTQTSILISNLPGLNARAIHAGTGLIGGGDFSADRTLSFDTTWGDNRYARATHAITAGSGLTGGGTLTQSRTLSVDTTVIRNTGDQSIAGVKTFTTGINMGGTMITNLGAPTAASDATTKTYVDGKNRTATGTSAGFMAFNGTALANGAFHGGASNPTATTRLNYNGYLYATRFYSNMYLYFSDRNLKENIETISPEIGIETVRKANPVSYNWKDTGHKALGLIAQEVEEIIPTAVKTNEVGIKSVDYVQLIAPMLAAIQDLDSRAASSDIRAQEIQEQAAIYDARIQALETRLKELENSGH